MSKKLTCEILQKHLSYDKETGVFRHLVAKQGINAGDIAGSYTKKGYINLKVNGLAIYAHRAAWLYVHGVHPNNVIDHINGIKTDNRIDNLRDVSIGVNLQNARVPTPRNTTGFLGVSRHANGRFYAHISVNGKDKNLGTFNTAEGAHSAYLFAKRRLHEGCTI